MAQVKNIWGRTLGGGEGSIKDVVEAMVRAGKTLEYADLSNADLSDADLTDAWLTNARLQYVDLTGVDLTDAWLTNTDLSHAKLAHAKLAHTKLTHADLTDATLTGIKGYGDSHEIAKELIKRRSEKEGDITAEEWAIIGKILIMRRCWGGIDTHCGNTVVPILQKLADMGYTEYLERYNYNDS